MQDILQEIVANKRHEVEARKAICPLETLKAQVEDVIMRPTRSMRKALSDSPSGIIAEFKRRSPSKGWLHPEALICEILPAYETGGAAACSVLTDADFFGGSPEDLRQARACCTLPLLRKDFIIDTYQLYEARLWGADAVLLIAAAIDRETCASLAKQAHGLGLEVLMEVHSKEELGHLSPEVDMLGVNNRHLGTFHTDVEASFRLAGSLDTGSLSPLRVSESGISRPESVRQLRQAGFQGFLIGETFMKTADPGETLSRFIKELA
ncbi:MAG: indole-3-glycerol phosphate synthase TrpC [Tannerella sp.]|jgi:indole-3-glycerol phosphate synthase|nr:indole-3-glycerol phosphate synthase TrpC [Tannerella sp.]